MSVRFVFRDITTTADGSSYFANRWKARSRIQLNSMGFREREFPRAKPTRTYRIAVLGDSFTFGQGILEKHRFTNVLERHLTHTLADRHDYEVLNFGTPGAETVDHITTLREAVLPTNPDFVVLQWFINDFEGADENVRPRPSPLLPSWRIHSQLQRSSALYYLLNRHWASLQETLGFVESYVEYMRRRFGDPHAVGSQKAVAHLREFIRLCRERGVGIGMALFPAITRDLGTNYPFAFLHQRVLDVCIDEGVICLDLRSAFASYPDARHLWVNRFDPHPGVEANRVAAEHLLNTFGPVWRDGSKTG